jgi:hypothetical protein
VSSALNYRRRSIAGSFDSLIPTEQGREKENGSEKTGPSVYGNWEFALEIELRSFSGSEILPH